MANPPTFVAPAFSALRWAIGFAVAMVAHQPLGWLCLGLFCWRFWQTLMRLNTYIEGRVQTRWWTTCQPIDSLDGREIEEGNPFNAQDLPTITRAYREWKK